MWEGGKREDRQEKQKEKEGKDVHLNIISINIYKETTLLKHLLKNIANTVHNVYFYICCLKALYKSKFKSKVVFIV